MMSCPLPSEFDVLVDYAKSAGLGELSEFQAMKAYIIHNMNLKVGEEPKVPTEQEFNDIMDSQNVFVMSSNRKPVIEDLAYGFADVMNAFPEYKNIFDKVPFTAENKSNLEGRAIISALADKLSTNLGVPYQFITEDEAIELTKNINGWKGQPGFFYNGVVYLVPGLVTATSVFHEFAHPFVRAIYMSNRPLYDKLVEKLMQTSEGKKMLQAAAAAYPNLSITDPIVTEEALVMSMTQVAKGNQDSALVKFVKDLLYAIKQLLRKLYGKKEKISIDKLDVNTSLEELADMLVIKSFAIDTKAISREDVASYFGDIQDLINDVSRVDESSIQWGIDDLFTKMSDAAKVISKDKNYTAMKEILKDAFDREDIQEILSGLKPYQDVNLYLQNQFTRLQKDIDFARNKSIAFIQSLQRLNQMASRMGEAARGFATDLNNKDNLSKLFYYNNVVGNWEDFLRGFQEILQNETNNNNLQDDNSLAVLVAEILTKIDGIKINTNKVYTAGVRDVIFQTIAPMKDTIDSRYKELMEDLKKRNAPQWIVETRQKDYWGLEGENLRNFLALKTRVENGEKLLGVEKQTYDLLNRESLLKGAYLTEEKIELLLKGKLGDASALNSFIEGYMYNQDPIVFGFATFVKNSMTDVFNNAQAKGNSFIKDVKPYLEKAGYNQSNPAAFGQRATFRDVIGSKDKTGQFAKKEIHALLNPFKDYRSEIDRINNEISAAREAAHTSGSNEELLLLKLEKERFERKFFHTKHTPEYYKRYEIFNKGKDDIIGAKAEALREDLLSRIQQLTTSINISTSHETEQVREELVQLWREYRMLHSDYTIDGSKKDPIGLAIAQRLREFRDATRELYDEELIPSSFTNALRREEDRISKEYGKDTPAYLRLRYLWIQQNTRIKIKDSFYKDRQKILDEISRIMGKLPKNAQVEFDISKLYENLIQLMNPYRDEDSQPEGTAMDEGRIAKIKEIQEEIAEKKKGLSKLSGLTQLEHDFLSEYFRKINEQEPVTAQERADANDLLDKRAAFGLSKEDKKLLYEQYQKLEEIQESIPTDYYLDSINTRMTSEQLAKMLELYGRKDITIENSNVVLTEEFYDNVVSLNPSMKQWYDDNHIFSQRVNELGEPYTKIERVKAWSVTRPKSPTHFETFTFTNSKGQEETIPGMPTNAYYTRTVKEKYVTKIVTYQEALEQGDPTLANMNNKGNFLPRLDIEDKRFINDKFFEVKDKDKDLYNAIIALSKWHLKFQEGLPNSSKLFLDVPRYMKSGYESRMEYFTAEGKKENPVSSWYKRVKALFIGTDSPDDYDRGYNFKNSLEMMQADVYDDQFAGIPITGTSALDAMEVSLDLTHSMLRYMISGEKQKKLIEINPIARALQTVVSNSEKTNEEIKEFSKRTQKNNSMISLLAEKAGSKSKKSSGKVRETAINNFIEREFEGRLHKGVIGLGESAWAQKLADNIMKLSAFGYFAMDIPSALKNDFSSRIQSLQEAAAGKYYNGISYARGTAWASNVTFEISLNLYKFGPKSLNEQIVDIFDAYQGRFEEKFHEVGSRSVAKDALGGLSWMTSFRKWNELNSALTVFGSMMYHQKVERTVDGVKTQISYMDAWEVVDGQIKLKDGVDKAWDIGGVKFKAFKNRTQGVTNNINGAFAKFDYAEADRYLTFRFIIAFKRWFIRMFMNRYQFRGSIKDPRFRYDAAVGDTALGFHVEGVRAFWRSIKSGGEYLSFLSDSEKAAVSKLLMDAAYVVMFAMLLSLIFGYDETDEDKFKKFRERSGPLPFPFLGGEEEDFKLGGWLTNHALMMTLQLKNETLQWLPVTGFGFKNYVDMLKLDAIAMKNTFDNYKKIGSALTIMVFNDDTSKAYFEQREGPYEWMQEGGSKALTYVARSFGITGKSVDPPMALTNWVKAQNWR